MHPLALISSNLTVPLIRSLAEQWLWSVSVLFVPTSSPAYSVSHIAVATRREECRPRTLTSDLFQTIFWWRWWWFDCQAVRQGSMPNWFSTVSHGFVEIRRKVLCEMYSTSMCRERKCSREKSVDEEMWALNFSSGILPMHKCTRGSCRNCPER